MPDDEALTVRFSTSEFVIRDEDRTLVFEVLRTGRPSELERRSESRYYPLFTSRGAVGVIGLQAIEPKRTISVSELRLFEAVATQAASAIERVSEMCALKDVFHQQIGTMSKGYKRRVGLAQAFLHDPDILILDEPTDGLDPNQKHDVRELIHGMGKDKCIVISTHILEEVDAVCSRAIIIARGKVLADGTPEELKQKGDGKLDVFFRRVTMAQEHAA